MRLPLGQNTLQHITKRECPPLLLFTVVSGSRSTIILTRPGHSSVSGSHACMLLEPPTACQTDCLPPCHLIMRHLFPVQRRAYESPSVLLVILGGRGEPHCAAPIFRSFWMDTRENEPTLAGRPFHDCRGAIRVLANHRAPTGKLRAIFPILFEGWSLGQTDGHGSLADSPLFSRIEWEAHARSQIKAVRRTVPGKKG